MDEVDLSEPVDDWLPGPEVTRERFLQWRSPRFGTTNPECFDNPVWSWLARTRIAAWQANEHFAGPNAYTAGPGWCCNRNRQSRTRLCDGRVVRIGGEHEDFYDPNFHIYNDVIVDAPDGSCRIFGYPKDVFPPTDFHSATRIGDRILVIGCLGYREQRQPGVTPVFALDTNDWSVARIGTSGTPPGWIHGHEAAFSADGRGIVVRGGMVEQPADAPSRENVDDWLLRLDTLEWQQITRRGWQEWLLSRRDGLSSHLWDFETAVREQGVRDDAGRAFLAEVLGALEADIGGPPDLDLAARLYRPTVPHTVVPAPAGSDQRSVFRIAVEGVTLRFVQESYAVRLVVEGVLPTTTVVDIVEELRAKLSALERCDFVAQRLGGEQ